MQLIFQISHNPESRSRPSAGVWTKVNIAYLHVKITRSYLNCIHKTTTVKVFSNSDKVITCLKCTPVIESATYSSSYKNNRTKFVVHNIRPYWEAQLLLCHLITRSRSPDLVRNLKRGQGQAKVWSLQMLKIFSLSLSLNLQQLPPLNTCYNLWNWHDQQSDHAKLEPSH